jgi:hypothetical protein
MDSKRTAAIVATLNNSTHSRIAVLIISLWVETPPLISSIFDSASQIKRNHLT